MKSVRGKLYLLVALMVVSGITSVWQSPQAIAADVGNVTNRSLTLLNGTGNNYASAPGAIVNHKFQFNLSKAQTVGSIKVEYCDTAEDPSGGTSCSTTGIAGISATNATMGAEDVNSDISGFTMGTRSANSFIMTHTPVSANAGDTIIVQANSVTNPTKAEGLTFYARITVYSGTDGATGLGDRGTVAAATTNQIVVSGFMPETLIFCTGQTVTANCASVTPGTIYFNQLFSPTSTSTASSQMAASSNANFGYTINAYGDTLKAGSNSIAAMTTAGALAIGTAQFGMNVKANNNTGTATYVRTAEVTPAANGTTYRGQAKPGYNTADTFMFTPLGNNIVAASDNGSAGPSNSQVYTVTYVANVPGNQVAGNYTTTLSYICTPTF